jgi:hypothetical protein
MSEDVLQSVVGYVIGNWFAIVCNLFVNKTLNDTPLRYERHAFGNTKLPQFLHRLLYTFLCRSKRS